MAAVLDIKRVFLKVIDMYMHMNFMEGTSLGAESKMKEQL